ncbi:hypothetical protein [Luteirhabdus pelagi]|uniref:hypothetical protein n=1 Tax=Luteirhabdus pelagi TaxID=2792783 RepID=UPI001939C416|nr:hypothetical protein [Luteirhabdus pelagi]
MKKYFKHIVTAMVLLVTLSSCNDDEPFFGDEIFSDDAQYPYVGIQDRNEDLEDIVGNNFWDFRLTAENNGNQVRIDYNSQDENIVSHDVIVGFDGNTSPPEDGVVIATITEFPTELVFTKADIAAALNVSESDLDTGSVYFGGFSIDADDHVISDPSVLETFLIAERHAYFYEWPLNQ